MQACKDRTQQVAGDPYSPPCYAFSGDNGGATHQGVTADTITVTIRQLEGPSAAEIFADISGQAVNDSPASAQATLEALAKYFSDRFQLYGRRIKLEFFRGEGSGASELLGGGKEKALADAVRAAKEHGAFADLSGITIPYADALAQNGVVNIGSPYPSQQWFENRRPYSWSLFPDGTNVVRSSAASVIGRFPAGSTVQYGGASLVGQPRKYATLAPENAEYQESVNRYIDLLGAAGIDVALNMKYKLDISSMPNQASNIIAQMKDAGITSILCGCDPVMLALGLTPKANEQSYEPEWMTSGLAFVDQDIVSQLIDPGSGRTPSGSRTTPSRSRRAARSPTRPTSRSAPATSRPSAWRRSTTRCTCWPSASRWPGPNLTPETFEAGMFAYPGGCGPRGLWGFGPGDYTPTDDYREIWWDPNRISGQNNKPGAWVQLGGGKRYAPDRAPTGPAAYFKEG